MAKMLVELSDRLNGIVEDLAEKNEISKADVLRKAISLMEYVDQELRTTPRGKKRQLSITQSGKILKDVIIK